MTTLDTLVWIMLSLFWGAGMFAAGYYYGRKRRIP